MSFKMKKQAISSLSGSQTAEQLLHDLQMHQIELEMQNEELRRTRAELEASRSRYFSLFDLAPVGYVILSEKGLILEVNLTAATQLRVARNTLINQPLTRFILPEDQHTFYHHHKQLYETGAPQGCELRMLRPDSQPFWVRLEATVAQDPDGAPVCRAALSEVTEYKQAEKTMLESEERFRAIASNTPDHILMQDRQLKYKFVVNPQLGLTEQDMVGKTDYDFLSKEEADQLTQVKTRVLESGRPVHFETSLTSKVGETEFFDGTYIPIFDMQDKVDGVIGYFRNITERKQAEEALRILSTRQEAILAAIPDIIMEVDKNKVYTWANPAGFAFFGEGVISKEAAFYFEGEQDTYSETEPLFEGSKNVIYIESWQRRKDGEKRLLAWQCRVLKDMDGNVVGALSSAHDITERKQAQDALRESQQLLEKTLAGLLDAVFIIDADTVKIIDCNPAASEIFGYSRQEMLSRTTTFLHVDQAALEEFRQHLNPDVEEKGFLFMPNFRMKRKDGTVFPTEHSVVPLKDEQGKHFGWVGVVRDITERKLAENELAQSHEQLHALTAYWQVTVEAERAYIAREMHDEFGQSMTALKMDLTWLAKRLPEGDERVERIHGMNTLVDDSIGLMRRIATELRPNLLDDLGLNAALEWQAREFSRRSGIPCKANLPNQDLGLDPALSMTLYRIFQETLTNVARHAQATHIKACLQQKKQSVILTISDNGRGISESELQNPRSLGLLGLRERAAQWGGETTILGVTGKGTTVTVVIPLPASLAIGGHR